MDPFPDAWHGEPKGPAAPQGRRRRGHGPGGGETAGAAGQPGGGRRGTAAGVRVRPEGVAGGRSGGRGSPQPAGLAWPPPPAPPRGVRVRVDPPVRRSLHCWSEGLPRFRFRPTLSRLPAGRVSPASVGAVGWRVCLLHRAVPRSILPVARLLFSPLLRACSPRSAAVKELSAAPALCIRGLYSFKGRGNR